MSRPSVAGSVPPRMVAGGESVGTQTAPARMAVFLVPFRAERYELYCEPTAGAGDTEPAPRAGGILARLANRASAWLAAEERGLRTTPVEGDPGRLDWPRRLRNRVVRWLTEVAAEQRLLWNLRRQGDVMLVYPADLDALRATALLRAALQRDLDRHRRWLVADTVGLVVSALFAIIPGPNLLAYYFAFRVGGHFLSMRGARQGLGRVRWSMEASTVLAELRAAALLAAPARQGRVAEVAARLGLSDLAAFFERSRLPSA